MPSLLVEISSDRLVDLIINVFLLAALEAGELSEPLDSDPGRGRSSIIILLIQVLVGNDSDAEHGKRVHTFGESHTVSLGCSELEERSLAHVGDSLGLHVVDLDLACKGTSGVRTRHRAHLLITLVKIVAEGFWEAKAISDDVAEPVEGHSFSLLGACLTFHVGLGPIDLVSGFTSHKLLLNNSCD